MQKSIGTNRLEMAAKLWSAYMDHDSTGEMVCLVLLHFFVHFVTVFFHLCLFVTCRGASGCSRQLSEVSNDCSRRSTLEVVAESKISSVLTAEEAGASVALYNALGVCGPAVDQIAAAINGIIGELGAEVIPPPTPLQEEDGEPIHSSESKESIPDFATSPMSMTRTPSTSNSRPSSGRFAANSHDMGHSSAAYGRHQRGSSIMDGKSDVPEIVAHGSQAEEDGAGELSNVSANIEWSVDGRETLSVSGVSRTNSFVGRASAVSVTASPKVTDNIKRPMGLTPLAIPRMRNFDLDAGSTPGSEPASPSSATDARVRTNMLPSQVGGFVPLECLENIKASLPRDLYDTVEAEIFRRLLQKYEDEFRQSEEYRVYFKYVQRGRRLPVGSLRDDVLTGFVLHLRFLCIQTRPLTMDEFRQYRKLGRGGFGDVYAVKRCTTGKMYALKIMDKRRVKAKQSEDLCLHERKILAQVDSPFICCLKYAFTTTNELCLILDLMPGGDLGFHLNRLKRFPPATARYFASRTLLAIAHMHSKKIVYRDLKPDNVLLDLRGRSFLSDLGLATKVKPSLRGVAGTRGYWAPDMLRRQADGRRRKYDQRVDFFSLGCFIYEMLVGVCPFRTERAATWPLTEDDEREIQKQVC
jgi:tRNA A-37 threonylcarbamoyl transferase component Bud32